MHMELFLPLTFLIINFKYVLATIDGNYRVITLFLQNMVIYPSVWRIMPDQLWRNLSSHVLGGQA